MRTCEMNELERRAGRYPSFSATITTAPTARSAASLCMSKNDVKHQVAEAIHACQDKKAEEITILELEKDSGAFTDYFVVCSGTNPRQVQAIADSVEEALKTQKQRPSLVEGYARAEWILLDYFDFIVHVFAPETRVFYDLERLWGNADRIEVGAT